MSKLEYSIGAIATIFAMVAGSGTWAANATPFPVTLRRSANLTLSLPVAHPQQWLAQNNFSSDCRKIGQDYTQFFTNFPGGGSGNIGGVGILNNGQRIRLLDGGQTYQYNGQLYYRVSSPFASQNPTIGYISTRTPLNYCGPRALW